MHKSQKDRIIHRKAVHTRQGFEANVQPAYSAWVISQLPNTIIPSLGELALTEDFLPIVEKASLKEVVPDEVIQAAISRIPELAATWQNTIDDFLLDLVRQSPAYSGREISKEVLSYASTLFVCLSCGIPVTYPSLIVHHCLRKVKETTHHLQQEKNSRKNKTADVDIVPLSPSQDGPDISIVDIVHGTILPHVWLPLFSEEPLLQFHTSGYYHTTSLLEMRGMELTTSMKKMLDLNPYVECLCRCYHSVCKKGKPGRKVMRWMRAVRVRISSFIPFARLTVPCTHAQMSDCVRHRGSYDNSFAPVNEALIPKHPVDPTPRFHTRFPVCPFCQSHLTGGMWSIMHLKWKHNLSQADAESFLGRELEVFSRETYHLDSIVYLS